MTTSRHVLSAIVLGAGTSYAAGDTFSMGASDVTLYARWTRDTYTMTYADGVDDDEVFEDTVYTITYTQKTAGEIPGFDPDGDGEGNTPEREGYTFAGWEESVDEGGNLTYTATWEKAVEETPRGGFLRRGDRGGHRVRGGACSDRRLHGAHRPVHRCRGRDRPGSGLVCQQVPQGLMPSVSGRLEPPGRDISAFDGRRPPGRGAAPPAGVQGRRPSARTRRAIGQLPRYGAWQTGGRAESPLMSRWSVASVQAGMTAVQKYLE